MTSKPEKISKTSSNVTDRLRAGFFKDPPAGEFQSSTAKLIRSKETTRKNERNLQSTKVPFPNKPASNVSSTGKNQQNVKKDVTKKENVTKPTDVNRKPNDNYYRSEWLLPSRDNLPKTNTPSRPLVKKATKYDANKLSDDNIFAQNYLKYQSQTTAQSTNEQNNTVHTNEIKNEIVSKTAVNSTTDSIQKDVASDHNNELLKKGRETLMEIERLKYEIDAILKSAKTVSMDHGGNNEKNIDGDSNRSLMKQTFDENRSPNTSKLKSEPPKINSSERPITRKKSIERSIDSQRSRSTIGEKILSQLDKDKRLQEIQQRAELLAGRKKLIKGTENQAGELIDKKRSRKYDDNYVNCERPINFLELSENKSNENVEDSETMVNLSENSRENTSHHLNFSKLSSLSFSEFKRRKQLMNEIPETVDGNDKNDETLVETPRKNENLAKEIQQLVSSLKQLRSSSQKKSNKKEDIGDEKKLTSKSNKHIRCALFGDVNDAIKNNNKEVKLERRNDDDVVDDGAVSNENSTTYDVQSSIFSTDNNTNKLVNELTHYKQDATAVKNTLPITQQHASQSRLHPKTNTSQSRQSSDEPAKVTSQKVTDEKNQQSTSVSDNEPLKINVSHRNATNSNKSTLETSIVQLPSIPSASIPLTTTKTEKIAGKSNNQISNQSIQSKQSNHGESSVQEKRSKTNNEIVDLDDSNASISERILSNSSQTLVNQSSNNTSNVSKTKSDVEHTDKEDATSEAISEVISEVVSERKSGEEIKDLPKDGDSKGLRNNLNQSYSDTFSNVSSIQESNQLNTPSSHLTAAQLLEKPSIKLNVDHILNSIIDATQDDIHVKFEAQLHFEHSQSERVTQPGNNAHQHVYSNFDGVKRVENIEDIQNVQVPPLSLKSFNSLNSLNINGSDGNDGNSISVLLKPSKTSLYINYSRGSNVSLADLAQERDFYPSKTIHPSTNSLDLIEQQLKIEDESLDNFIELLKIREKSLIDRTKVELIWLDLTKKNLLEHGEVAKASNIKKKQRGLMLKLQQEKHEMQRLKQKKKESIEQRKVLLKEQKAVIKKQLSTRNMFQTIKSQLSTTSMNTEQRRHSSGPIRVTREQVVRNTVESSSTSQAAHSKNVETTHSVHSFHSIRSISTERYIRTQSNLLDDNKRHESDKKTSIELTSFIPPRKNLDEQRIKLALSKREHELKCRRQIAEQLLRWHQRLNEEEQQIALLEAEADRLTSEVGQPAPNAILSTSSHSSNTELTKSCESLRFDDRLTDKTFVQSPGLEEKSSKKLDALSSTFGKQYYQIPGAKLNKIWTSITGTRLDKYDKHKVYRVNRESFEKFYENAKREMLRNLTTDRRPMTKQINAQWPSCDETFTSLASLNSMNSSINSTNSKTHSTNKTSNIPEENHSGIQQMAETFVISNRLNTSNESVATETGDTAAGTSIREYSGHFSEYSDRSSNSNANENTSISEYDDGNDGNDNDSKIVSRREINSSNNSTYVESLKDPEKDNENSNDVSSNVNSIDDKFIVPPLKLNTSSSEISQADCSVNEISEHIDDENDQQSESVEEADELGDLSVTNLTKDEISEDVLTGNPNEIKLVENRELFSNIFESDSLLENCSIPQFVDITLDKTNEQNDESVETGEDVETESNDTKTLMNEDLNDTTSEIAENISVNSSTDTSQVKIYEIHKEVHELNRSDESNTSGETSGETGETNDDENAQETIHIRTRSLPAQLIEIPEIIAPKPIDKNQQSINQSNEKISPKRIQLHTRSPTIYENIPAYLDIAQTPRSKTITSPQSKLMRKPRAFNQNVSGKTSAQVGSRLQQIEMEIKQLEKQQKQQNQQNDLATLILREIPNKPPPPYTPPGNVPATVLAPISPQVMSAVQEVLDTQVNGLDSGGGSGGNVNAVSAVAQLVVSPVKSVICEEALSLSLTETSIVSEPSINETKQLEQLITHTCNLLFDLYQTNRYKTDVDQIDSLNILEKFKFDRSKIFIIDACKQMAHEFLSGNDQPNNFTKSYVIVKRIRDSRSFCEVVLTRIFEYLNIKSSVHKESMIISWCRKQRDTDRIDLLLMREFQRTEQDSLCIAPHQVQIKNKLTATIYDLILAQTIPDICATIRRKVQVSVRA